jgi:hypothetical protein
MIVVCLLLGVFVLVEGMSLQFAHAFHKSCDDSTEADERALQAYARERTYLPEEKIEAHVDRGKDKSP